MIDFIDPIDREKRNRFKGSHFVVGISAVIKKISVYTQPLTDPGMPMIIFHLKFEE